MGDDYEKSLDQLWEMIKTAGPKKREQIINSLDQKTITALRTRKNPYKKPVISGKGYRMLAFNFLNITDKYSRRFAMTALIGFLYRMLDEYTPQSTSDNEYLSENDPKFANIYNKLVKELITKRPSDLLIEELNTIKAEIPKIEDQKLLKEKIKRSYVLRSKIIKYNIYLIRQDKSIYDSKKQFLEKDVRSLTNQIQSAKENLETTRNKLEQRIKYEERKKTKVEKTETEKTETETETEKTDSTKLDEIKKNIKEKKVEKKVDLTYTEIKKRNVKSFEQEIENIKKLQIKLDAELIEESDKLQNLLDKIKKYDDDIETFNESFRKIKTEYLNTFKNKALGKVSFLDSVEVDKYEPTEAELDEIAKQVKKELNIEITAEEHQEQTQNIVQKFLDKYLRYNPDIHVRCAYKPNYADPTRTPLENETAVERTVIPPDDTFFRLDRYIENNYEELRQANDDIYCEKSDFEADIVPLEVFIGDTKEEAMAKFDNYKRQYAEEFESDVFCSTFNVHNLLSPFENNREVRDFYTKETEVIKRIIDQNKEDSKFGKKIIAKNAENNKTKETPEFKQYQKQMGKTQLEEHGAVSLKELNDTIEREKGSEIKSEDIPRNLEEVNDQELEVGVHILKARRNGRRTRGFAETFKFNIPSEDLEKGQAVVQSASEFQKKLLEKEGKI